MSHIYLAFSYNNSSPISRLIRFFTWGEYSHVALVNPETGLALESNHSTGVQLTTLSQFFLRSIPEIRRIPHSSPAEVWSAATSQIGKEYDMAFLWGWILRRNWQDPEKWSCSELIAWAAKEGGKGIISDDRISRVVPEHLYMISEKTEVLDKFLS